MPLSAPARQLLSEIAAQQNKHLEKCQKVNHYPTSSPATAAPVTSLRLSGHGDSICKAAGIKGLRVHDLRHSFASQLASGGASLPLIGALLGHSSPVTTARYAICSMIRNAQRSSVSVR